MIYVGDHQTLLYTKYISCEHHGYRIEDFFSFYHYKSMLAIDLQGPEKFAPKGLHFHDTYSVDFIFLSFGIRVLLEKFETIRGSLMTRKWQKLASLAQEICTV